MKATIQGLSRLAKAERESAIITARAAGAVFLHNARMTGAVRDGHDDAWMAKVDHPYAVRHGSIQTSVLGHPGWWAHFQTGRLQAAIKGRSTKGGLGYQIYVDEGAAPHAKFVIKGTRVMFGRDFIRMSVNDPKVRKQAMRTVVSVLGRGMRSKAGIRFGGGAPPALPAR